MSTKITTPEQQLAEIERLFNLSYYRTDISREQQEVARIALKDLMQIYATTCRFLNPEVNLATELEVEAIRKKYTT